MDEPVTGPGTEWEVREALVEMQRYFADELAPLMMVENFEILRSRPDLAAQEIGSWAAEQYGMGGGSTRLSDFYFHALKKIHLLAEYKLVSSEDLAPFFEGVAGVLLGSCPAEEREALAQSLGRLGRAATPRTAPVALHRAAGTEPMAGIPAMAPALGAPSPAVARPTAATPAPNPDLALAIEGLRRYSVLLDRLGSAEPPPAAGGPALQRSEIMSRLLALAVREARTGTELESHLEKLRSAGVDSRPEHVLSVLSGSLPGWAIPLGAAGAAPAAGAVPTVEALRRFVTLARNPSEGAQRLFEMVKTATNHFNEGSLGRAATLFGISQQLIAAKKVDEQSVEPIRRSQHEKLDSDRLRQYAEDSAQSGDLQTVLNFFPALTAPGLITELEVEERRERRRLLVTLLLVHGRGARLAALEHLSGSTDAGRGVAAWYFHRNLLNVLRRIPREENDPIETEVAILDRFTRPGRHISLVKDAIANLALLRHEKAVEVLLARLRDFERLATSSPGVPYPAEEVISLLDRVAGALIRSGSPAALAAVIEHALTPQPAWGDGLSRLAELSSVDLSRDPAAVSRVVAALRSELPRKVFGMVMPKAAERAAKLVTALSGTRAVEVRQLFEEICQQYPENDFAKLAARASASLRATPAEEAASPGPAPPAPSLSGDLDLFGLPGLLQSLSQGEVSGLLTISDRAGALVASIELENGRFVNCRTGLLRGRFAVYQLFEEPLAGTFAFLARRGEAPPASGEEPLELMPLLLEGSRRYDELRQARALLPASGLLEATGQRPTAPEGETEPGVMHGVWTKICSGSTPPAIGIDVQVDSYRVYRLLAHWLEEGSLRPKAG